MYRWDKVVAQASAIKRTKVQRHELEIHVEADPHQRNLRVLELSLIILVKFTTNSYY